MKNIRKIAEYIGFVMFLIGGAGMDSDKVFIPAVMVLSGLAILYIFAKRDYPHC